MMKYSKGVLTPIDRCHRPVVGWINRRRLTVSTRPHFKTVVTSRVVILRVILHWPTTERPLLMKYSRSTINRLLSQPVSVAQSLHQTINIDR